MLLQVLEGLRRIVEGRLGELRQRILQILRQLRIEAIPDPGVAHDAQQMQMLLDIGAAEEPAAKLRAVVRALLLSIDRVRPDCGPQGLATERHPAVDEMQVEARPARGDEPPGRDLLRGAAGADAAAEGEI